MKLSAFIDSSGREEAVNPVSDVWSGGQDGRLRTVQSLQGGNSNTTKSHRFDIDHQRINLSNSVNQQPRRRATAELNHGNTHVPHMTAMRTYHFFSYLELDVFRALFAQEQHREYVTKAIASALLTWYFPLQEGYCVAPEQERSRNTPDFIIYTVKHNVGHIDLYDCVFIEVKRNHLDAETQVWNACEQTENDSGVCYACTFNQWDLKFYRFVHRLNSIGEPASCTPFSDKIDIRYEAQEVDRIFDYMRKNPLPYY
ncbi:MAG: hypothetical protein M1835_000595 [Candelina submexicana]|nr:MAG: hypothetical protein M1835_000595 [Candelina submexicana]